MEDKSQGSNQPNLMSNPNGAAPEVMPFSEKTLESQQKHRQALAEAETKKKGRMLNIPTDDKLVQARLRELAEPIILFGELPAARRERLRGVMAKKGIEDGMPSRMIYPSTGQGQITGTSGTDQENFWTEGTQDLKNSRLFIAKFSLQRARDRLELAMRQRAQESLQGALIAASAPQKTADEATPMEVDGPVVIKQEGGKMEIEPQNGHANGNGSAGRHPQNIDYAKQFEGFTNTASEVGDDRPLSFITYSKDGAQIATSGWSGVCKVWDAATSSVVHTMRGHSDRATSVAFHPNSTNQDKTAVSLASSGADCNVILWSMAKPTPVTILKGHFNRVNQVAFHPSGRFVGSVSTDMTWHLWDVETGTDLLEQEGHAKGLQAIGFQCDGSLACTAGTDAIGRVWDLRSGKSIYIMRGHGKAIYGLDWSPNGYQIATCSEDDTIRIWDLRKKRFIYTIPAHESLISQVKYHPNGELLLSSSFDTTIKLWSATEWTAIKAIKGNEGKIMCADISPDLKTIVTANYDRTWRMFSKP
eukprot:TRINITY_DN6370_c0_g1_i1.p1 TRINITY_DN6370_c0_g1~~TRINITY_DN6370_c0_g1_i1.p1  ORF type:complete len:531 (+),score=128.43 TRINITY_DN6370_c0_g1_i1:311-1903(+)